MRICETLELNIPDELESGWSPKPFEAEAAEV